MKRKKGLPSYPGSRSLYIMLSFIMILEAASIIFQAIFLSRSITFLFQGKAIEDVILSIALFFVAFLTKHALVQLEQYLVDRFAEKTVVYLRKKLVESYFELGPKFVQVNGTGRLVTLAIEGIEQVKAYFELTIPKMLRFGIIPVFIVLYVFTEDVQSGFILVFTIPIIIIFMILLGLAAQKMADKQYETYRVLSNHFIDTLKGLETLKFLGRSKSHEGKISRVSKEYRKATIRTLRVAFLSSFALDFFTSLSVAFVAVGLGIRLIDGSMVLLPALTILILAPEYFLPIRQVGSGFHATLDGQVALAEIEEIITKKNEMTARTNGSKIVWNETSKIKLENIDVQYEGTDNKTLKNINFSWEGNGCIGIVGESGAGKSTFIDVLAGFLPVNEGQIIINGEKTTSLSRTDWLENTAYIPQHPYIFPLSLKENICFYEPASTDEEVEKIIDKIGLRSFVAQLPNGIHERIGEGGRMLSGGQEQRIAIARALLSKRPIILLDEPTAHLDVETEFEMLDTLLHLFEDKLVFLATHRLHWMKHMDHILVVDKGSVVEEGTYEELREKKGEYHELVLSHTGGGDYA